MNVRMEAPDLRGTVLLINLKIGPVKVTGSVEIQPIYPRD